MESKISRPVRIMTAIAFALCPTKLLVGYLRKHASGKALNTVEGQKVMDALDRFPDTWRPCILLTPTEIRSIGL